MSNDFCIIITTCSEQKNADAITQLLLEKRLAACIQSTRISSSYVWKNNIVNEPEILLIIKAPCKNFADIESAIKSIHSYDIPEIIQLPITNGSADYLGWIANVCN